MTFKTKTNKLALIALNPGAMLSRVEYLFMLSHMRSRSSVLSHVLGSNPGINGYAELHYAYRSRFDLFKLRLEIFRDTREHPRGRFLFDKLLHNECVISDWVFEHANPKIVFLLREPTGTLKSLIHLGLFEGNERKTEYRQAKTYYCSRLRELEHYADKAGQGSFFVESDDLIDRTDAILAEMSEWLGLNESLKGQYKKFSKTGKAGAGDSGEAIHSGVITKTQGHPGIQIPDDLLQEAQEAYEHCKRTLESAAGDAG